MAFRNGTQIQGKKKKALKIKAFSWSCYPDSDRGPHPYQWHFHRNEPLRNGLKSKELQGFSDFGF